MQFFGCRHAETILALGEPASEKRQGRKSREALRIRDVTDVLRVPHQSINALIQYLKRKHLVKKTGQEFSAPYALTDEGRAALAEMTRRHAA